MTRVQLGTAHEDERTALVRRRHGGRAPPPPFRLPEDPRGAAARATAASLAMASRRARTAALSPSNGPSTRLRASLRSSSATRSSRSSAAVRSATRASSEALAACRASAVRVPLLVEPRVVDRARDLVGDDRDELALVLAEGAPHRALDREHADQLVAHQQRNGDLALRVGQAGDGNGVAELLAATGLHHLPPLRRGVRPLLPEVAHVQHLALLRHDADHAGADPRRVHRPPGFRSRGSPRLSASGRQARAAG